MNRGGMSLSTVIGFPCPSCTCQLEPRRRLYPRGGRSKIIEPRISKKVAALRLRRLTSVSQLKLDPETRESGCSTRIKTNRTVEMVAHLASERVPLVVTGRNKN